MTENWRLIPAPPVDQVPVESEGEPAYQMALDEAVALGYQRGDSPPTLRIYGWRAPALTIGRFQSADEIDWEACRALGVPVARRLTGGSAVFHDRDLTYAIVCGNPSGPSGRWSVRETYLSFSRAFLRGFDLLGLEARPVLSPAPGPSSPRCFSTPSWHEIAINGRKVIGSAQKRWRDSLLQQGSVPLEFNPESVCRLFHFPAEEERREAVRTLGSRACGLNDCASRPLEFKAVEQALIGGFEEALGIRLIRGGLFPRERETARRLAREKYLFSDWTHGRSQGLERV